MAPRRNHALFTHYENDRVMLAGGYQTGPAQPLDDVWEWNGRSWRELYAMGPAARSGMGAAWYGPRKSAVMMGGHAGKLGFRADTWLWERSNWNQMLVDQAPPPRYLHAMAALENREALLLFGGAGVDGYPLGDTWIFERQAWKLLELGSAPSARAGAAAVYDAGRKRLLLFGGAADPAQPLGDFWSFDGGSWSWTQTGGMRPR
jgi:hypothetical protein